MDRQSISILFNPVKTVLFGDFAGELRGAKGWNQKSRSVASVPPGGLNSLVGLSFDGIDVFLDDRECFRIGLGLQYAITHFFTLIRIAVPCEY